MRRDRRDQPREQHKDQAKDHPGARRAHQERAAEKANAGGEPILGKGSYGEVTVRGGCAVKRFHKLSHLVQEYAALQHLQDSGRTVRPAGADFAAGEIAMELCATSLRRWITDRGDALTQGEVLTALRGILEGLAHLHARGLVHGDLKPGNVLVKTEPFRCVLGDLGFVSVARYAKCERTAPAYRDPVVKFAPAHDMFSFGIIFYELAGRTRLRHDPQSYRELRDLVDARIRNRNYRKLLHLLLNRRHDRRPGAAETMQVLFRERPSARLLAAPRPPAVDMRGFEGLQAWYVKACKFYLVNRPLRGAQAAAHFFAKHRVPTADRHFYLLCCILVESAIFGTSGFSQAHVLREIGEAQGKGARQYAAEDVHRALRHMLEDREFLAILYS